MKTSVTDHASLLDGLVGEVRRAFIDDRAILSFREYFELVLSYPRRHLRGAAQYVVDMLDYFGSEELELPTGKATRYRVFDAPFARGEGRVAGQEQVQERLYRVFSNFAREGRVNKLVLLHGPNGSAKSSIVRCLMGGMEAYGRTAEGAIYSFSWIFPLERLLAADRIGFGSEQKDPRLAASYARLPAESIDARVFCDLHDHPLFLLPEAQRAKLFAEIAQNSPAGEKPVEPCEYLRRGDLCYKCRRIYDALLASYDGDAEKVLRHVQVERLYVSRRYRRALASIEPQLSVDARVQQVTADRSLGALPKALQHTALYEPTGPLVDANRGLLEYSDLLKRPVEAFKYLLDTVETSSVVLDSFLLHLDMVLLGSTNETYLDAFKEHPDFPSFKGRMELIKVPLLLRYESERDIYASQITERVIGRHIAPHALDVAALWAVLTRMRRSDPAAYPHDLGEVIDSLTPFEKLMLYDRREPLARLGTRENRELLSLIPELYAESRRYVIYEGRFGASAREIRSVLLNAAHLEGYGCLSPLAVFRELAGLLDAKTVHEFLRQEVVRGYYDHAGFLREVEEIYTSWIDDEVREATGIAQEQSYAQLFGRYVLHVSHWVKGEKLRDQVSLELREPDQALMSEIEKVLIGGSDKPEDFRRALISTIGARALEVPEAMPDYAELFKSYIDRLREDFFTSRRKELARACEVFLKHAAGEIAELTARDLEQARAMGKKLVARYGYCAACARDTVAYLLRKRYAP